MANINFKSFNQLVGEMARKIVANSPANDINPGSVLMTILEAAAANDYDINVALLNVLELLNIDAVRNNDLDAAASNFGIVRTSASKATGFVTVTDTNITKRSTTLYPIKPAPIKGSSVLYVNNAANWEPTGSLYIGRGTSKFEGPIEYTSIVDMSSFYKIILNRSLENDHLISEEVVDSQNTTDRLISAGLVVKIPANNRQSEITYTILRNAVIPAGEDHIDGVAIVATASGSLSNASINTITRFDAAPFVGATVANTTSLNNGRNVESDEDLRNRIKSYASSLARGTKSSILTSIQGLSDQQDSKQVASAVITEPVNVADPSIVYVDDGTGFEPSFSGQSVDLLLANATGKEEFLQLSNYPLPRPQIVNKAEGPYELVDGMILRVRVDGVEESVYFSSSQFTNISSAKLIEVVAAINDNAQTFKARTTTESTKILIYADSFTSEKIQIISDSSSTDANVILKFPTTEFSSIKLYNGNTLLNQRQKSASLESINYNSWNITGTGNLVISVDGTPSQDRTFDVTDFGGLPFASLTLSDWVSAFNAKFAGLSAKATSANKLLISSNRIGSASSIEVLGGTYANKIYTDLETLSIGQDSDFILNRQNGNIQVFNINAGDNISAGSSDTKASVISHSTISGAYNLSTDSSGREAVSIIVADADRVIVRDLSLAVGTTISIQSIAGDNMRVLSNSSSSFKEVQPGDYMYIAYRSIGSGWLDQNNCGLFKVNAKGNHITAGVDSWIQVANIATVAQGPFTVLDPADIQIFYSNRYPQIWRPSLSSKIATIASSQIQEVVSSLNSDLSNITASVYRTSYVRVTSSTEGAGSIAMPVSIGNAINLFATNQALSKNNQSHIANKVQDKDFLASFKRTNTSSTYLDRHTYTSVKGNITSDYAVSDNFNSGYSEQLTDSINNIGANADYDSNIVIESSSNKGQIRAIEVINSNTQISTRHQTPRTTMDYSGDVSNISEYGVAKALEFSSDDNMVIIMDDDSVAKTVDVRLSRTGRINGGSNGLGTGSGFNPNGINFSASDNENESTVDFSTLSVWGTGDNQTQTNFKDYAVWFRARNWYVAGGFTSPASEPSFMIRANQYGPNGSKIKFRLEHPILPNKSNTISHSNDPEKTVVTYTFGSGSSKNIDIASGNKVYVSNISADTYRYTLPITSDLSSVNVNDVLSISQFSGISSTNSGTYNILAVSDVGKTIDVINPNGTASVIGVQAQYSISCIREGSGVAFNVVQDGNVTQQEVTTVTFPAASDIPQSSYFYMYSANDVTKYYVWFNISGGGVNPAVVGTGVQVNILSTDTAAQVAAKVHAIINPMTDFNSVDNLNGSINVTNASNGFTTNYYDGTTLNGRYFILTDSSGSTIKFWYDVNNIGTSEPGPVTDRSVQIDTVSTGDASSTVATKTASFILSDIAFAASTSVLNTITVTYQDFGPVASSIDGGTSFAFVSSVAGVVEIAETINNINGFNIFSLINTSVDDIVGKINESSVINAVTINGGDIYKATREERTAGSNTSYSFLLNDQYIGLFDSNDWVLSFQNVNYNFTLKQGLVLPAASPHSSIYQMNLTSNPTIDNGAVGELFKLIPITLSNIKHHLSHRALSQLEIVSDVAISSDNKKIQIKSEKLGSNGAIEIVGGRANGVNTYLLGDSQVLNVSGTDYLEVKIPAYPDTYSIGHHVRIANDNVAERLSRLSSTDTIDIVKKSDDTYEYHLNHKDINFNQFVRISISDVSLSYGAATGTIWRWQHNDAGSTITMTDIVNGAVGNQPDYRNSVGASISGTNMSVNVLVVGSPSTSHQFVLSVYGQPMQADYFTFQNSAGQTFAAWFNIDSSNITPTGSTYTSAINKVTIDILSTDSPNEIIGKLANALSATISGKFSLIQSQGATLADAKIGDMLFAWSTTFGSGNEHRILGDAEVGGHPIIAVGADYVDVVNVDGSAVGSTLIGSSNIAITPSITIRWYVSQDTSTKYRIESLGYNNLYRLRFVSGSNPLFVSCGVAVDDVMTISGETFKSNNSGSFRVLAVDETSVVFENEGGIEELDTIVDFNSSDVAVNWTSSSNTVTGSAGSFINISLGDWVKKIDDEDYLYRQVISRNGTSFADATQIILGSVYSGTSSLSKGIAFDQANDVGKGLFLKNIDDVKFYEGDSCFIDDTLYISNTINSTWFSLNNAGTFSITEFGTDATTRRPFVRITNTVGTAQLGVLLSTANSQFKIIESENNKYTSIKQVAYIAIDDNNSEKRVVYLTPGDRSYKWSESHRSYIVGIGKLGYSQDIVTGIDGYLYYTGLLRTVQRTIDGYEPNETTYPGRKAIGSLIEVLPPLRSIISLAVNVTTENGVNLSEITDEIRSSIINYVIGRGVGEDVILSDIVVRIKGIDGVAAVTFVSPIPSTERITIADNQKAYIEPADIDIS